MRKILFGAIAAILLFSSVAVCGYYVGKNVLFRVAYTDIIQAVSQKYDVDQYLLMALIAKESGFNKALIETYSANNMYNGAINLTDNAASEWADKAGIGFNAPSDLANPAVSIELAGYILATAKAKVGNDTKKIIAEFLKRNDPTNLNDKYVNEVMATMLVYRILYFYL